MTVSSSKHTAAALPENTGSLHGFSGRKGAPRSIMKIGIAAAAVLAVLLVFTGVTAAETIDFSSGEATVSIGSITIADGKQLKVNIDLTNLSSVSDGEVTDITFGGLSDVLSGLKMASLKVKMSSSGLDTANSTVYIGTPLGSIDYSVAELSKGLTFTEDTKVLGFVKVLDYIGQVSSFKINMLPTSSTASISMNITADITQGKTVSPQILIVTDDVNRFTANPVISLKISSGGYYISKQYLLDIDYEPPTSADTLVLKSGWNFVSVPKKLSADYNTAAELFAGVDTDNKAILSYDAETKLWETVTASTEIKPLNAYWIYSVEEKEITPAFDTAASVPASKTVYKGWNAVGISAEQPMTAAEAFNNINWRTYLAWNAAEQKYGTTAIKGNKGTYSEDTTLSLWKGGWLFMDEENTIIGYA